MKAIVLALLAALAVPAFAQQEAIEARLDLRLPESRKREKLPVIVSFSGAEAIAFLVQSGEYAVVAVRDRLEDEAKWPAPLEDARAAIRWVRANAEKHRLDAKRIGVWGRGAGAHLALMVGADGGRDGAVAAVANFAGITDLPALAAPPRGLPADPAQARAASPISYIDLGDPPVLTVHGTEDPVVPYDQAVRLDVALRTAGVRSTLVRMEGAGHADFGAVADEHLARFFARHLLGKIGPNGD